MNITISGNLSFKFAPEFKEHMSTQELVDGHILGYIESKFREGSCVYDSFLWNVKNCEDYNDIIKKYKITNESDFENFFNDYIAEDFINDYFEQEYIFKKTDFEVINDFDDYNVYFEVDLCITLEQLCQKYNEYNFKER